MKINHTHLKRLAAISFVLMLCLSALPMLAPSASAAGEDAPLGSSAGGGNGYVAITFDDCLISDYLYAYPLLSAAGMVATSFVTTDRVGASSSYMTQTHLLELQAAGWEIGSHGIDHTRLTSLDLTEAERQFCESKAALQAMGLDVTSFAYPGGQRNDTLDLIGEKYYDRLRGTGDVLNLYLTDYSPALRIVGAVGTGPTPHEIYQAIDKAAASGSATVLYLHGVAPDGTIKDGAGVLLSYTLQDIISYIESAGVETIRFRDLPNERDTYLWDGEGADELASNPTNWRKVAPSGEVTNDAALTSGAHYAFNKTSVMDCSWDLDGSTITPYTLLMQPGYTGHISQLANISIGQGGFIQSGGVFTGSTTMDILCAGSVCYTGGDNTVYKMNLIMSGSGVMIMGGLKLNSFTVTLGADVTTRTSGVSSYTTVIDGTVRIVNGPFDTYTTMTIGEHGVVDIQTGAIPRFITHKGSSFTNNGVISGSGTGPWTFELRGYDLISIDLGSVTTSGGVRVTSSISATGDRLLSLGSDVSGAMPLYIESGHASYTVTLDANDHDIEFTSITIGTRGAMLGGEGVIRTAAWDSSAGSWTPEDSTVVLSDGGTVKLAPGQSFNRLEIASDDGRSASWTMTATGAQAPIVTGLESGVSYRWYLDGVKQGEVEADENGTITLSYMSTGLHTIEVKPTSMTLAMDGMSAAIGIIVALAVLGGLITMVGRLKF